MTEIIANNVSIKTHTNYTVYRFRIMNFYLSWSLERLRIFTNTIVKIVKFLLVTTLLKGAQIYMQFSSYIYWIFIYAQLK